jgi:hypothetical protein
MGFVSNSSSSSFVLLLDKKPESVEEVFAWLFPDGTFSEDTSVDTCAIAQRVFDDLQKEMPVSKEALEESIKSGHHCKSRFTSAKTTKSLENALNAVWSHGFGNAKADKLWEKYRLLEEKQTKAISKKMLKENKQIFILEYEDCIELESAIEHSGVLEKAGAHRISHH